MLQPLFGDNYCRLGSHRGIILCHIIPLFWRSMKPHTHLHHSHHHSRSSKGSKGHDGKQAKFIPDNFSSLDQVISALRESGLESSNLILGIDFTKSNEWTGRNSFGRRSLHAIGGTPNPYEQAITIIGHTLSPFDEDNLIPCYGFGDTSTRDQSVFSFYPDNRPCHGFEEALARYRDIVPHLKLSGPTSFAPVIQASIDIVKKSNWQYHVLVIIADGQVARNSDVPQGRLSPQEGATMKAIVDASFFPLSIIMVGVGDGPWDTMEHFDDCIPERRFDNFQFVNFTNIMSAKMEMSKKEAAFALAALMEIPFQYKATQGLRPQENQSDRFSSPKILPPPKEVLEHDSLMMSSTRIADTQTTGSTASTEQVCPICLTNPKDMAFGCGHLMMSRVMQNDLQGMWCHLIDMPHMPSTHNYTLAALCLDDGLAPKPVVSYLNRLGNHTSRDLTLRVPSMQKTCTLQNSFTNLVVLDIIIICFIN
ncbi:E3 ubiquitin-protein ligase RGLG3-like isoform X1 [Musa acuminata AAA Group]|uniref:E3 ubiquitin-protein ligase RGLG3-like isoform X1 n=2 Tax=Musa acuminata AAA Group TaxID=214697 RepID=UPI0031D0BC96